MSAGTTLVKIGLQGDTLWSEIDAVNDLTFAPEVSQTRAETTEAIEVSPALIAVEGLRAANARYVESSSAKRKRQIRMADHLNNAAIETRIEVTSNNQKTEILTQQLLKAEIALNAAKAAESTTRLRKEKSEATWSSRLERHKAMIAGLGIHIEAGLGADIEADTDIEAIEASITNLIQEAEGLVTANTAGQSKLRDSLELVLKAKRHFASTEYAHERAVNTLRLAKLDYDNKMTSIADKKGELNEKEKKAADEDKLLAKHGRSIGFEVEQSTRRERFLARFSMKRLYEEDK
jgi:hypothetical protein